MRISNKKIFHDYHVEEELEVGIVLVGGEIKSIIGGSCTINQAYCYLKDGECFISNMYVKQFGNTMSLDLVKTSETRDRKLLLKKREIESLHYKIKTNRSLTLVVSDLYTNARGKVKLTLCLVTGKKKGDKREAIKEKDLERQLKRKI